MQIDFFTVLVFGLFIKLVLGGLFFVFWYRQRSATLVRLGGAPHFFSACVAALLFATRGFAASMLAIGIGNVVLIAVFACCWQAARVFDRRRVLWLPVFGAPALCGLRPV